MRDTSFNLAVRDITNHVNRLTKVASSSRKLSATSAAAKDIVDMESFSGNLADTLGAGTFGGDRAGRSQAMAAAAGRDPSFGVKHPVMQTAGYTTLGALAGGLMGTAAGAGVGALRGANTGYGRTSDAIYESAAKGGVRGTVVGTLYGLLMAASRRRQDMRATNEQYDEARSSGKLKPKAPELSAVSAALLPFRGAHRRGQMQGYYMASGEDEKPLNTSTQLKYIAEHVPYLGLPASVLGGYGQNIATQLESRAARGQKTSQVHRDGQQVKIARGVYGRVLRSLFRAKPKSQLPAVQYAAPNVQRAQPLLTDNRRQMAVPQRAQPRLTDNRRQMAVPQRAQPLLTDNRRQMAVPQQPTRLTDNRRQMAVPQQPTRYPMSGPLGRLIDVEARRSGAAGGSATAAAAAVGARSSALRNGLLRAGRTTFNTTKRVAPYVAADMLVDRLMPGGSDVSQPAAVGPTVGGGVPTALPTASAQPYGRVTSFSQLPADFQQRYRSRNASGLNIGYNDQAAVDAFNRLYAGTTKQLAAPSGAGQRAYTQAALNRRGGLRGTAGTAGQP